MEEELAKVERALAIAKVALFVRFGCYCEDEKSKVIREGKRVFRKMQPI